MANTINMELNPDINVYWQGVITSISTGFEPDSGMRWSIIVAQNKCLVDDAVNGTKRARNQRITIYTKGGLSNYVFNELEERDRIYVVGALISKTNRHFGRYSTENAIEARQIFKCDYLNYYTKGKD